MTPVPADIRIGRGGRPYAVLRGDDGSAANVYLHGAHVTSWTTPGGAEQLYLSEQAVFDGRAPIRGGIPIIFPQFAAEGALPKHGFARTMAWVVGDDLAATPGEVTLELRDTAATRSPWDVPFVARLRVRLGAKSLELELLVRNPGKRAMHFTAALHTYLRTPDDGRAVVRGLSGCEFRDAADAAFRLVQRGDLAIEGEINRVYFDVPEELVVELSDRTLRLQSAGLPDAVVWNPGVAGAAGLADMPSADARRMLCIEPAAIGLGVGIPPGGEWRGSHRLLVGPIAGG